MATMVGCSQESSKEAVTPAGYEYIKHTNAKGDSANQGDYVYFHAQTRNGDQVVNSSRMSGKGVVPFLQIKRKSEQGKQVSPVQELLQIMRAGDSVTIILPLDTLTVAEKPAGFKDADIMFYDLVMLEVKSPEQFQEAKEQEKRASEQQSKELVSRTEEVSVLLQKDLKNFQNGTLKDHLVETQNGIKLFFHNKTNAPTPSTGDKLTVNYTGALMNGSIFDSSFEKGESHEFHLGEGRVIPGWEEAMLQIPEHSTATIFVPFEMAYGASGVPGKIPEKSDLVFYIELVKIN